MLTVIVTPARLMTTSSPATGSDLRVQVRGAPVQAGGPGLCCQHPRIVGQAGFAQRRLHGMAEGGSATAAAERAARSHPPPREAAPIKPVAAETSAPVARARPWISASPALPAPARQLHSRRSPRGPRAAPIAAKSAASSLNVSVDQSPAAKLTRPGAPWAMIDRRQAPALRQGGSDLARSRPDSCRAGSPRLQSADEPRIVSTSTTEGSTKTTSRSEFRKILAVSLKPTPSTGPAKARTLTFQLPSSGSIRSEDVAGGPRPLFSTYVLRQSSAYSIRGSLHKHRSPVLLSASPRPGGFRPAKRQLYSPRNVYSPRRPEGPQMPRQTTDIHPTTGRGQSRRYPHPSIALRRFSPKPAAPLLFTLS